MGGFGTGLNALSLSGTNFGLGQGLNVQSIVQTLTQAAEANESIYTNEQTLYNTQAAALTNISTLLTSLQTATQALQDPAGAIPARVATSSNPNVVTASAASGIATGSYSIAVTNLASTSTYIGTDASGNSLATGDTVYGNSGTITIQVGGPTGPSLTVNVGSTNNTLNSLANYINSSAQNPGVTASVITDASGARLSLTSNTSGAPGEITLTSNVPAGTGTPGLSFSEPVQGLNAALTVNGVSITSTTNTVSGVVPGLTLNLTGTTAGGPATTISVGQDTTQATTAVDNFVSAYNAVVQAINTQFTYTAGAASQPPLFSDSTLQQVQQTLGNDANYAITGNSGITGLSAIGVNLQQDGTLSVDSAALNSALSANPAAVQNFFQGANFTGGFAGQLYNDINTLNDPVSGAITLDLNGVNQEEQDVTQTIADFNANLLVQEQQWTLEYSQVNATLQQLPILLAQAGDTAATALSTSSSTSA